MGYLKGKGVRAQRMRVYEKIKRKPQTKQFRFFAEQGLNGYLITNEHHQCGKGEEFEENMFGVLMEIIF